MLAARAIRVVPFRLQRPCSRRTPTRHDGTEPFAAVVIAARIHLTGDMHRHAPRQVIDSLDTYRDLLATALDIHLSVVSNDLS